MLNYVLYFIIFAFSITQCDSKKYSNYTLYRVIPVKESHLNFLSKIDGMYNVNFWRSPSTLMKPIDFVINPSDQKHFLREAESLGLYLTTLIHDVQKAFDKQTVKSYIRRQMNSFDWMNYFRIEDIYTWLTDLSNLYPEVMTLENIGKTHENRDIMSVRILLKDSNIKPKSKRPVIIVEGGIHAREWIAPAFVTYLIYQILHADTSNDKALRKVAYSYEWYFIPVLNVDGYEYTHTADRLWRKNRHGHGVDINRNFAHGFGTYGVSLKPQSEIYCGPRAFSEMESKALSEFIKSKSESLKYYFAFHSYGQYMILPYADSMKHLDNFDQVSAMCKRAAKRISLRDGTKYVVGTAYDTVGYTTSGVSGCWVKSSFKVPYVITFELRDDGADGFALPPSKILPTCKETLDGLVDLCLPRQEPKIANVNRANTILDAMVLFFNVFLFIIVRFQ